MKRANAEIIREYGPFPDVGTIHGVTYDGQQVWLGVGERLQSLDPATGEMRRAIDVAADAGTAFDGRHLYQIARGRIQKIDPQTGQVLGTIPAPSGSDDDSGLAWAEGSLWVGQYAARRILQVDPDSGKVLRTLASDRHVTGVTWAGGELWHGTWEDGASELRRIDPHTAQVQECLALPSDVHVSGLESDGADRFFCGGGNSGKLRVVRRPG